MKIAEKFKIVPVIKTADFNAGVDGDSINMKGFHSATFILTFGAVTGDAILTVNSGATDGAKTSALTFRYALGSAAIGSASCDVLGSTSTSAALTLTAATYQNKMLVVHVNAADMDLANNENWLTISLNSDASAGILHAVAILEPRYSNGQSGTALA